MGIIIRLLVVLALALSLPSPGYKEETRFLRDAGFEDVIDCFKEEEVEIGHIARLSDSDLRELGVSTMGGRIRLRDAAMEWTTVGGAEEEEQTEELGRDVEVGRESVEARREDGEGVEEDVGEEEGEDGREE